MTRRDRPTDWFRLAGLGLVAGAAGLLAVRAVRAGRRASQGQPGRTRVEQVVTINAPIGEVYRRWCDVESFPQFMRHVTRVERLSAQRTRWRVTAPAGLHLEWEAEQTERTPEERIAWRTIDGSILSHEGSVTFSHAPGARGTEVRVVVEYSVPAAGFARLVARAFGEDPVWQVRDALRRFKQVVETGEVAVSDGPGLWRPARPEDPRHESPRVTGAQR